MLDEDAVGGHDKGAIHCGEKNISKPTALAATVIRALALGEEGLAVLHYMENLHRGPRSAYRLTQLFAKLPDDMPKPQIKILQGGADQRIRNHWASQLVEGYDDDICGYEAFPAMPPSANTTFFTPPLPSRIWRRLLRLSQPLFSRLHMIPQLRRNIFGTILRFIVNVVTNDGIERYR